MTAATATAPVKVSPRTVRMHPEQFWYWGTEPLSAIYWRRGPDTPDGLWMIHKHPHIAVRIVRDLTAEKIEAGSFDVVMNEAVDAQENDVEDAYLATLTVAASLPIEELIQLRDRVRSGRAGGAVDGSPRRVRKAATA